MLNAEDVEHATRVGILRWELAEAAARHRVADQEHLQSRADHIFGAQAELAVARELGTHWNAGINVFHAQPDVAYLDVRASYHEHGRLLLRPKDDLARRYVLATRAPQPVAALPAFWIVGWAWGHEAMRGDYLSRVGGRPACYLLPQDRLHALDTLPPGMDPVGAPTFQPPPAPLPPSLPDVPGMSVEEAKAKIRAVLRLP